jgi:hypothetical protein
MYDDAKKKMVCHQIVHKIAKNMVDAGNGHKIEIKDLGSLF